MTSVREQTGWTGYRSIAVYSNHSPFFNRKFEKAASELHPIPIKPEVWHTVGVDLIGSLPKTAMRNKYTMTVSCLFSKWPEATALKNKKAVGVAKFLFKCFTVH